MTEIRQLRSATPLRPATPQCEARRENPYYSDRKGEPLPRCSHSSSYMLEGRHLCARHAGAAALRLLVEQASRPNKWREAVLDRVAVQCWDPAIGTPARVVVDRMLEIEVDTALDPAVSERAAALVDRGREEAREAAANDARTRAQEAAR